MLDAGVFALLYLGQGLEVSAEKQGFKIECLNQWFSICASATP